MSSNSVPSPTSPLSTPGRTVADLLQAWSRDYLPDLAPKSRPYYTWLLRRFARDLGALQLPAFCAMKEDNHWD